MSNALKTIRDAVKTVLTAQCTAAKWVDNYNGEDWDDEKYSQMRRRQAEKGNGLYVTLPRTSSSPSEPMSADENFVQVNIVGVAGAIGDRDTAAEAAEALIWAAYVAMRKHFSGGPDELHTPWLLIGFEVLFQDGRITIASLTMIAPCDFGYAADEEE